MNTEFTRTASNFVSGSFRLVGCRTLYLTALMLSVGRRAPRSARVQPMATRRSVYRRRTGGILRAERV
jgi:hypothetical protein